VVEALCIVAGMAWIGATVLYAVTVARGERWSGLAATGLAALGWLAMGGALVGRAQAAGHWPLSTSYEFALVFAWATVGLYLLLEWRMGTRRAGAPAMVGALLALLYAWRGTSPLARAVHPLPPALQSIWFPVHAGVAALSYGAFTVAAAVGVGEWANQRMIESANERMDESANGRMGEWANQQTGGRENSDRERKDRNGLVRMGYQAVRVGYALLSLSILTGAIWAQEAWGTFWSWDLKESWALITWLWYTLWLHLRLRRGWRGKRLSFLSVVGLGLIWFTFIGVGWLARRVGLVSLHVY